jgi:probable O-glycosylation ligase (exosortase A-associated)
MRAYLFVLIYAGYLPLVLLTPFAGAMLWAWVSLMYPQTLTYGFVPFSYAALIAVLTLGSFALSRERRLPPASATSWAMVGMILACGIAYAASYDRALSFARWDTIWKGLLLALVTLAMLRTRLRIHGFVWIMALSIGFFGLKGGLFSFATGGAYRVSGAEGTIIGDNNHLAVALVMAIPLIVYLAIHSALRIVRVGCWIFAFFVLVAALFTYSRGGALALAAMMGLLWLRSPHRLATLAVLGVFGAVALVFAPDALWARFGSIDDFRQDSSAMGRLAIWRVSLILASQHPLTGIGFQATALPHVVHRVDPTVIPRAVHNSYLEVLVEAGIFAFLCHLVIIVATARHLAAVRTRTRGLADWLWARDLAGLMQVSLVGYLVGSFFISFAFYDGWWFIAVVAAALRLLVRDALSPPVARRPATLPWRT